MRWTLHYLLVLLWLGALPAEAARIDLSTLAERGEVQLTIYNSEDLTLVRERRTVSLRAGANPLQFAWSGTLIDPTSVSLHLPDGAGLKLLETRFPHDRPESLDWLVEADKAGPVSVEISYFTSGLTWAADYQLIESADSGSLVLTNFIRISNNSGEAFDNAQVRLVVGEVNLVQRVVELAQRRWQRPPTEDEVPELRYEAAAEMLDMASYRPAMALPAAPMKARASRPVEVLKETLGDYFIYTVEGRQRVEEGYATRIRNFQADKVAVKRVHRLRQREYGPQLTLVYLIENGKAQGLGLSPLPAGEVRLYRRQADEGLRLVTTQGIDQVAIDDELELVVGLDPDLELRQRTLRAWSDNLWLEYVKGRVFKPVGDPNIVVDHDAHVAGWDQNQLRELRLANHGTHTAQVELRMEYAGDAYLNSDAPAKLHDYSSAELLLTLAPGEVRRLHLHERQALGYNQKQDRLLLGTGPLPTAH